MTGTMSSNDNPVGSIFQQTATREAANSITDAIAHETASTMISELANSRSATEAPRTQPASAGAVRQQQHQSDEIAPNAIFSSIGLGIVNDFTLECEDATEAAFKAVQDAVERGGLGLSVLQNLVLSVRVGVPGRAKQPSLPMHVDVAHLTPLVPPTVSLSRLEVVIGGLLCPVSATPETNRGGICSAVACLSFFQQGSQQQQQQATKLRGDERVFAPRSPTGVGEAPHATVATSNGSTGGSTIELNRGSLRAVKVIGVATGQDANHQDTDTRRYGLSQSLPLHMNHPKTFHRANSMEVLARISAEIHDQQQPDVTEEARLTAAATAAHNYKKLPPGKTPKNNKRLFVKHEYHDWSGANPTPGEEHLTLPDAPLRTPNAAFPLKLHETLEIIERDGLDHVIGWMPHGRSFKIHKHQQFVDDILPHYFV